MTKPQTVRRVEASGRAATSSNVHLSASYDLERATARNLGGGFPNEKDVSNNSVYAGDASLGGGTTARHHPRPEQSAAWIPTPGGQSAGNRGCLGGSGPNFTLTDKAGTTYKLNIPPTADTSKLGQHVGEPVAVAGNVNGKAGNASIDVQSIGRGT